MAGTADYLNIWGGFDLESLGTPPRNLDGPTRQALWEGASLARSARAYHLRSQESDAKGAGQGTDYGAEILRRTVPEVIKGVTALQEQEFSQQAGRGNRKTSTGTDIIGVLDAAAAALIAVSETLGACLQGGGHAKTTQLATKIMSAIKDDMDCRTWLGRKNDSSMTATTDAEKRLRERFLKTYPSPTRRQWVAWARKIEARTTLGAWSNADKVVAGAALLSVVVGSGETFARTEGSLKTPSMISLTPQAVEVISRWRDRRALTTPRLLPMLIKPLDWLAE